MSTVLLFAILLCYVLLSAHDCREQLLPNTWVAVAIVLTLAYSGPLLPSLVLPAALWPALYFLLWRSGGGIGGGDVKLAFSTGFLAAHGGALGVLISIGVANLLSIIAIAVCSLRTGSHTKRVAHGPFMMLSAGVVFVVMQ